MLGLRMFSSSYKVVVDAVSNAIADIMHVLQFLLSV